MKTTKIEVKQDPENQVPIQIIADAIVSISNGIKKLLSGPLSERALIILLTEACPRMGKGYHSKPVTSTHVKAVLKGLQDLERQFIKQK